MSQNPNVYLHQKFYFRLFEARVWKTFNALFLSNLLTFTTRVINIKTVKRFIISKSDLCLLRCLYFAHVSLSIMETVVVNLKTIYKPLETIPPPGSLYTKNIKEKFACQRNREAIGSKALIIFCSAAFQLRNVILSVSLFPFVKTRKSRF